MAPLAPAVVARLATGADRTISGLTALGLTPPFAAAAALHRGLRRLGQRLRRDGRERRGGLRAVRRRSHETQRLRQCALRRPHHGVALRGPAVTAAEAPHDAVRRRLRPDDAALAAPRGDAPVALEGPAVAGLLVRPEREASMPPLDRFEHREDIATVQHQRAAEAAQRRIKVDERVADEAPMAERCVVLPPKIGFDDIQRQHGTAFGGGAERRVVVQPQVALEPDDLRGHGVVSSRARRSATTSSACDRNGAWPARATCTNAPRGRRAASAREASGCTSRSCSPAITSAGAWTDARRGRWSTVCSMRAARRSVSGGHSPCACNAACEAVRQVLAGE